MKMLARRFIIIAGYLMMPLFFTHCMSLSNFKTAKALGIMEDGKPQVSAIVDVSTPGSAASPLGEFNIRYPLKPFSLEMGNKVWFTLVPVPDSGLRPMLDVIPDLKYTFFSLNKFSMAIDVETDIEIVTNANWDFAPMFGIGSTLLLTFEILDWFKITLAPKIKYYFEGSKYLYIGGIATFDFGKDFGIIPEVGFFDQLNTVDNEHDPLLHLALGLRFDSKPATKK